MLVEGSILNVDFMDTFKAAISQVHKRHRMFHSYEPKCPDCSTNRANHGREAPACDRHLSMGRTPVINTGNPILSLDIKDISKIHSTRFENSGYRTDRKSPLYPHDLDCIHKYVKNTGYTIRNLQQWVMSLLAIHIASRFLLYASMTPKSFNKTINHWVITHSVGIHCIHIMVKEKNDQKFYTYRIPFQNAAPHRCFLRHLLIYLHVTQIHNGPLFPCKKELNLATRRSRETIVKSTKFLQYQPYKGNKCQRRVTYKSHCKWLARVREFLPAKEVIYLKPHSFRFTTYVLGFLGGGDPESVTEECRHRDSKIAKRYQADALQVKETIKNNRELSDLNKVEPFQKNLVEGEGLNTRRINSLIKDQLTELKDIHEVARYFVEEQLQVKPGDKNYMNWGFLLEKSYKQRLGPGTQKGRPLWNLIHGLHSQQQPAFALGYHYEMKAAKEEGRREGIKEAREAMVRDAQVNGTVPPPLIAAGEAAAVARHHQPTPQNTCLAYQTQNEVTPGQGYNTPQQPLGARVIRGRQRSPQFSDNASDRTVAHVIPMSQEPQNIRQEPIPMEALDKPQEVEAHELIRSKSTPQHAFMLYIPKEIQMQISGRLSSHGDRLENLRKRFRLAKRLALEIMDVPRHSGNGRHSAGKAQTNMDQCVEGRQTLVAYLPHPKTNDERKHLNKFFSRNLTPIVQCLFLCHGGNVDAYANAISGHKFTMSNYYSQNPCQHCMANNERKQESKPGRKRKMEEDQTS